MNLQKFLTGSAPGGGGFNAYAAGNKVYGAGRPNPTMGPVDRSGYIDRDAALRARRNAILRQLSSAPFGQYNQPGTIK